MVFIDSNLEKVFVYLDILYTKIWCKYKFFNLFRQKFINSLEELIDFIIPLNERDSNRISIWISFSKLGYIWYYILFLVYNIIRSGKNV